MSRFDQVAALLKAAPPVPDAIRHEDAWTCHVDNILAKLMLLKEGQATVGHAHHYDHMTLIAKGSLKVIVGDQTDIYRAPSAIHVKAGMHHILIALEDSIAYCIHDTNKADADNLGEPY